MKNLKKKLSDWVTQGLISAEQQQTILKYEDNHEGPSKVLFGFLLLGFSIIGIGVISLIAANWVNIPNFIKLIGNFLVLGAVAYTAYNFLTKGKELAYEVASAFLMILFLASIGLISQIYHTGGELYQALFFWCFITSLMAYSSNRSFVPYLWSAGFFGSMLLMLFHDSFLFNYYGKNYFLFIMILPYFSTLMTLAIRRLKGRNSPQYQSLLYWTIQWLFMGLFMMEVLGRREFRHITNQELYLPGYLMSTAVIIAISISKELSNIQKSLLLAICISFLIPFHLFYFKDLPLFLIKPSITIICLTSLALFCASIHHQKMFQKLLTLIGIRFLMLYFQAFGGLAYTGFGLIISGLIIIGTVYLWNKYRKEIQVWAEGMVIKK